MATVHAPDKPFSASTAKVKARHALNAPPDHADAQTPLVCGLNLVHPFAAICAGKHLAFWSCFASPLEHMRKATHHAVALALRRLGCRGEDPSVFDFSRHVDAFDMGHDVENWLWCMYVLRGEKCGWTWSTADGKAPPGSPLAFEPGVGLFGVSRRSPPLWQGALWRRGARTTIRCLMNLVDEVGHVCTASGAWMEDFEQARKRWGPAGLERSMRAQWALLIRELKGVHAEPAPGFGALSERQLHEGQQTLSADSWSTAAAADPAPAQPDTDALGTAPSSHTPTPRVSPESATHSAPAAASQVAGGWDVDSLVRQLTGGQRHSQAEFRESFVRWRGRATPRAAHGHKLAAPTKLEGRGGPLRHFCWYNRKAEPTGRTWQSRQAGGLGVKCPTASHQDLRLEQLRARFGIDGQGMLTDAAPLENVPAVMRLWAEAQRRVIEADITPNAAENRFILDRLLDLEARFDFVFAAATDGSVAWKEGVREAGRAALLAGEDGQFLLGGAVSTVHEGFDTQSYDTELEAFADVISHVAQAPAGKRRVLIVTDCLSGSQALWRFHTRSLREKVGCFRDDRLAGLQVVEDGCEVVVYVWLHSHVNITLSEGADTAANAAREGVHVPSVALMRPHAVAVVPGIKRGHATAMIEAMQEWILREKLLPASTRTLRPTTDTWEAFLSHDVERSPFASDAVLETMGDLQADRLGLQGDRKWAQATRHSYGYFLRHAPCALCGDPGCRQTREDVLLRCQAVASERSHVARALRELVADVPSARNAVQAVEGGDTSPAQELDAVRFLSGLPNAPGEWDEDCTKDVVLQRRVGRRVHGAIHVLIAKVLELNHAARSTPATTLEGKTHWSNLGALGMHPRWCLLSLGRRALHAWRDEAAANGPNRTRARESVRQLKLCIRQEEEQRHTAAWLAARADLHRLRALVCLVVSTGRAPGLYELGLQQTLLRAMRDVANADVTHEETLHREVRLRWEQEGEEMMLDFPRARDFEMEDISFGALAAGWRWRLVHLLAGWRTLAARGFLSRRLATRPAARPDERLHRQLTQRWERFRDHAHRPPVPLSVVSGLIVETLRTRWEGSGAGPRRLVLTSTASTRETHRILRARHAPGVLSLPWHEGTIPEQRYELALEALEAERHLVEAADWRAARNRLDAARLACGTPVELRDELQRALQQARPVVTHVWCPIDAGALLDWMRTPQAREVPRRKDGTSYGDTGEGLARRLLDACQLRRTCNGRPATWWLKITYRHAELGDWLLAAGWVSFSRLYADGADPFRLPSAIRRIALAKFGWELDDAAAYMRIVSLLLPDLRVCVESYLRSKGEIGDGVASTLLSHLTAGGAAAAVKSLFLSSLFGGDVFEWKRRHHVYGSVDCLSVPTKEGRFHVGGFCAALRDAAGRYSRLTPRLRELVGDCGKGEGATLSYAAQDWEGMLREAKRMWGDMGRHHVFNLQHDGVAAQAWRRESPRQSPRPSSRT